MLFNPAESIDLKGNTGPFIQYGYARTHQVLGKIEGKIGKFSEGAMLVAEEKSVIRWLGKFPSIVHEAGEKHSPAEIANYVYELVKFYNHFYHECQILKEENADIRNIRLAITQMTGNVIKTALRLLGIEVPERM
jgi:arginyl-tRNA synthetase